MNKVNKQKKVLIALSGGIDSAVSAYLLLKQGYKVEAAFMKNWSSTAGLLKNECPWLVDRQDALRVAAFLKIPLHTLDFEKQYQKNVMGYFFKEYKSGRTPNPDVMCNKEVKFKLLYNWAIKNGFDYLATGHYAKIGNRVGGRGYSKTKSNRTLYPKPYTLLRSSDEFKDQTYFIYNIKTEQLPHILFPIGHLKKPEVRKLAQKIGLPNANKKESMGLCFVGKVRLKEFLEQKLKPKPGPIVLLSKGDKVEDRGDSKIKIDFTLNPKPYALGYHQGLYNYTIGQRQGIKVGGGGPYYVVRKDLKTNTLYVTNNPNDPALETKEIEIHSVNWIGKQGDRVEGRGDSKTFESTLNPKPYTLLGRFRHQGDLIPLTISPIGKGCYHVIFKQPQKAIASGQSLVLYKGKECLGGGVIV